MCAFLLRIFDRIRLKLRAFKLWVKEEKKLIHITDNHRKSPFSRVFIIIALLLYLWYLIPVLKNTMNLNLDSVRTIRRTLGRIDVSSGISSDRTIRRGWTTFAKRFSFRFEPAHNVRLTTTSFNSFSNNGFIYWQ